MTAIQNLIATGSTNTAPPVSATSGADIQDRFLKLLVTQMKNQDPLNPMDNAQVTSQLAQINTVNGIQQLNTTMQNMSASFMSAQSLQSAALIGRTVITDGNTLALVSGGQVAGGAQLAQPADSVKVNIVAGNGSIVRQIELGPQRAGLAGFQWDGLDNAGANVASGNYSFQVAATSGGQKVDATTVRAGTVSGVTLGSDGLRVTVGGIGDIQMQQIRNIM